MQHYFDCFQIGSLTLIFLVCLSVLLGLVIVQVVENYKVLLKFLGIIVGVTAFIGLAEAVGMAVKAIFKL